MAALPIAASQSPIFFPSAVEVPMQLHELAGLFPAMSEAEFSALKSDIEVNGQREPIWVLAGKVIDGKHRLRACRELGIEPAQREYLGNDPIAFVVSMNLHRRHLEHGQRAMLGDRIREAYDEEAKQRQVESGKHHGRGKVVENFPQPIDAGRARDQAGQAVGVSGKSIDQARHVRRDGVPELVHAVETGVAKVSAAAEIAHLPPDQQQTVLERVSVGETTFAAAARDVHNHRAQGTGDNEWYTPATYIDDARRVMGAINLDPASCARAQETIRADAFFCRDDDGLCRPWSGRVWLNPPYSQPEIRLFAEKAVAEVKLGRVTECIVLTHNYTDTAWFHTLGTEASAICFTRGRIGFLSPDGRRAAPTQGQAFFYFGNQADRFAEVFSEHGLIVRPK
jgi:ParB family chromosome partitioning protein